MPSTDDATPENAEGPLINVLVIVNDQPYGSERPYNALRLAGSLAKRDDIQLRVFLLGDAVGCAVAGQQLPEGHYHLDRILKPLVRRGEVGCCGTCLDARGLNEEQLVDGARRATLPPATRTATRATPIPTTSSSSSPTRSTRSNTRRTGRARR